MPSLLSRIGGLVGNAAIPAAAARGAYKQGKTEGQHQSMVDRMQQAIADAQITETKQRGEYYKGLGDDQWFESSDGGTYNRRSGERRTGPGKSTPHGEEHYDPIKDEVGFTTINSDGTTGWKKTRNATMIDKMKYERVPRDPSDPAPQPPERPGVAESRENDLKRKKADDLVSSFLATHDLEELTAENLQVFAGHILTGDERSALGRARTPPAADRAISIPPIRPVTAPKVGAPGKTAPPPVAPRKKPGEDPIKSVKFEPVGGGTKSNPQDEADKAALRKVHPEMSEVQITELLAKLRTKPPEG